MKYKLLVLDVDGTLTDGKIHISEQGELFKTFDVKDGYGIKNILPEIDMKAAIITGRQSEILALRAKELDIEWVYQGVKDKVACLKHLMEEHGYVKEEVVYVGDDLNDLGCMKLAGYTCCPKDAHEDIICIVDYVAKRSGGAGAVREIIDMLKGKKQMEN